jgi:hypothetical protein
MKVQVQKNDKHMKARYWKKEAEGRKIAMFPNNEL